MPPFDAQKHPFSENLEAFVDNAIRNALFMQPKSMPCSVEAVDSTGTIVSARIEIDQKKITWPLIKMPVYGPRYLRWPLKKGDKGVMLSADYSLAVMSDMGKPVRDLTGQGNLSTGVFFPIGNSTFGPTDDPKKTVLYGPDGVIIKSEVPNTGKLDVNSLNVKTSFGAGVYTVLDASGFKVFVGGQLRLNITAAGTFIDGINFMPHHHGGVQSGGSNTGGVSG